jgi:hypothetical protein
MVRATLWTVGLFGAGTALCREFSSTWTEPIVLVALGLAFLFVSARTSVGQRASRPRSVTPAQTREAPIAQVPATAPPGVVAPSPAPATAPLQVERTV